MFRKSHREITDFGSVFHPEEAMEPILPREMRDGLMEWLTEIWAEEELAAVNLKPRKRALFGGVPGVGKTTLAHHLSARLGLPMLAVKPDRLIDSWLGSSGRNIGDLFETTASLESPVMLFFDEFDSVAIKRRQADSGASEERNSWVNTLLQRIDEYDGFLIAATNRGEEIDPAVWRRFDIQMTLSLPGASERSRILERYIAPYRLPEHSLGALQEACSGASPALMRAFCEGLKRQVVVGPLVGWSMVKETVLARVIASIEPHKDTVRPPLWSADSRERKLAFLSFPWPLERTGEEAAA